MEAHRSLAGILKRKPLGDCTNTVSKTTSSSSSTLVKFANPNLTSSLKKLLDQTSPKETLEDVNNSKAAGLVVTASTSVSPVTRRISNDLGFQAPKPSRRRKSRSGVVGNKAVAESYTVVRRKASGEKRNKDASSSSAVSRLRLDLISSPGKKRHQADENKPKPSKVAPKKLNSGTL